MYEYAPEWIDNEQCTIDNYVVRFADILESFPQGIHSLSIIHYQLSISMRQRVFDNKHQSDS